MQYQGAEPAGATTSTITRNCDRPIDERKGLPTMQMLSEAAKQVRRKGGKVTVKPLQPGCQTNRDITRESEGRGVVVASPSQAKAPSEEGRGGWTLTMKTHGVEFSIAGGVEEIVRDPNPMPCFFLFSFFIMRSLFLGTRSCVQR